jgi:bacteriocin-like protein
MMDDRNNTTDQELTEQELDTVSGGLNPQPLPPRWSFAAVIQPNLAARVAAFRLHAPL